MNVTYYYSLRDLNGKTRGVTEDLLVDSFGENITIDNNGTKISHQCEENLKILNKFFIHKDINTYTRTRPRRQFKSVTDYCIIKKKSVIKALDVKAMRESVSGTDHYIRRTELEFPVRKGNNSEWNRARWLRG